MNALSKGTNMKKGSDKEKNTAQQQFKIAIGKIKIFTNRGQHMAIENLLKSGDGFSQALVLFDIMIDTDTVQSLLIEDEKRIKILCDFYKIKIPATLKKLLLTNLKLCEKARRLNILKKQGVQREREAFVCELGKIYAQSQHMYKQK